MTTPTDHSANQSTPIEATEERGSELGGATGSASELLQKWHRLMGQRRDTLESRDIYGIEQEMRVLRTDTDILLSFMQGTLKLLAAHEAKQPPNT